ncbi:MAG: hypothetical protein AMXMBFR6_18280 [Betaproteobacteria bacterium]
MTRSLYTRFASGLLFPLHERLKGHDTLAARVELERSQWLSPEALRAMQVARLRALLKHAAARVPYYRNLFARIGFDPEAVRDLAALHHLPVLTKELIRTHFEELRADDAHHVAMFSTTGSSGDPLRFLIGRRRVSRDVAAKWRATRWWDVDIGDREIVAWSSPIELGRQDRIKGLRDRLLRTRLVPAIALTPARLDAFVGEILDFRPRMLFGYPSALALVAQHARAQGVSLDRRGIQVAFVTAERLYPHQRDAIEQVFGCRVANGYGGRDAGFLAHECPAGQLHITAEDVIIEVVGPDGRPRPPGEVGQVVVTHLHSHEFPFIRYVNGDLAALSADRCACGRGLPSIAEVHGRVNEFLVASSGARVLGVAFAMLLRDMPGVLQFKIIQHALAEVELQLVRGPDFDAGRSKPLIERQFRNFLGDDLKLRVVEVGEIVPEPTGKYRYVVNRIAEHGRVAEPGACAHA